MLRGRDLCPRHYAQLDDDLRERLKAARRKGESAAGSVVCEVRDWFARRRIGPHEVVRCRGKRCKQDLVWLRTKRGKAMPVEVSYFGSDDSWLGVTPECRQYDHTQHQPHWGRCASESDFRRVRDE